MHGHLVTITTLRWQQVISSRMFSGYYQQVSKWSWVASWCKLICSNQVLQSVVVSEEIIFQYHNNYTAHNHCPVLQIAWLPLCSYGNQVVPTEHP